jgi:flagellar motor switch protein FliM
LPQTPFERGFKDRLRAVLEPLVHADVDIWLDGVTTVAAGDLPRVLATPMCTAVVGLVPRPQKALLEVDLTVAQACIDRILGGNAEDVDVQRPLSEIEDGVFSFVLLKALALVQQTFGGERQIALRLESVVGDVETLRMRADVDGAWVCLSFKLFFDLKVGYFRIYLPHDLVREELPAIVPDGGPAQERFLRRLLDRADLVRPLRAPLTVEVGRLSLAMSDLEALDVDDIILVEQSDVRLRVADDDTPVVDGVVTCRVGRGEHGVIGGRVVLGETGRYEVVIETLTPLGEPSARAHLFRDDGLGGGMDMGEDARALSAAISGGDDVTARLRSVNLSRALGAPLARALPAHVERADHADRDGEHSDSYDDDGNVEEEAPSSEAAGLLDDITVAMIVELGRVNVSAADVLALRPGQVIELSRAPGEPVDLVVDGKRIGKGELVEIDGELGVRILSLAK